VGRGSPPARARAAGVNRGAPSVLVLSHLYPSTGSPTRVFVARLVQALEGTKRSGWSHRLGGFRR
jgi:hypothetical protein